MNIKKEYTNKGTHHLATRPVPTCRHFYCASFRMCHPKENRWITAENATTEELIAQIKKCPSGALSYRMNNEKEDK